MTQRLCITATLCVGCAAALLAQQQEAPPTFRSAIEAVQIDVYVTDADGNPVGGLTIDDFELIENGKPQTITTFEAVNIPIERPEPLEHTIESDVLTNDGPLGRVYLFALDEVGGDNILRTRRFVRQFIEEHFGPRDLGAIALLGRGLATDGHDFTNNRRLLLNAIDRFSGGFGGACSDRGPVGAASGLLLGDTSNPQVPTRRVLGLSQQVASLRALTELMARMPGRHKAMLLFTECLNIDTLDLVDYNGGILSIAGEDMQAALSAATRSNLAIYPIDPTGLSADASIPLETIGAFRSLGEATGGFALINSNSFTETFERIVRENSTYYMLAFNSGYDRDDGRYVRVDVRVKRPGLTVHARDGYVAPTRRLRQAQTRTQTRSATSAVSNALANPLATSGVPMRVHAAPFKGRGRDAIVPLTVEIDAAALGLTPENGQLRGTFDLRYLATDAKRKIWPEVVHSVAVDVKPDKPGRVPLDRVRIRVVSELELPKGRYQLRVAAGSTLVAGNIVYDLEVPDFGDGPMTLSGVALVARTEPEVLTLRSARSSGRSKAMKCYSELCAPPPAAAGTASASARDPWLDGRLPGPPTTAREFAAEDELTLVAEIYDNTKRNARDPHTMTLTVELRMADGTVVPLVSQERPATAARSASGGHAFDVPLSLRAVPGGAHVLRVQAQSSRDGSQVVTRELPIRVR